MVDGGSGGGGYLWVVQAGILLLFTENLWYMLFFVGGVERGKS
jgi:hypothetical protein